MAHKYDLHTHSTASDGWLSPETLVKRAAEAGLETIALTDHDTTEGIAKAADAARKLGIGLIPGVEISVRWGSGVVHLVGLNIDTNHHALQRGLARLKQARCERAHEMIGRLKKAGVAFDHHFDKQMRDQAIIGRMHFARFLVEHGYTQDINRAFKRYLGKGKPGYVPCQWAALDEAVEWIGQSGGKAVIAHPARYPFSAAKLTRLIEEFVAAGGVGFEVVSGGHTRDDCMQMAYYAHRFRLLGSAGSDYHGDKDSWVQLGRLPRLPDGVRPIWDGWEAKEGRYKN